VEGRALNIDMIEEFAAKVNEKGVAGKAGAH